MTAPCFYLDSDELAVGRVVLAGSEGHHAVAVKRLRIGEEVLLSNGRGSIGAGQVAALIGRDSLAIEVREWRAVPEPVVRLTVALAVIKGERLERAIEQLGEVGVDDVLLFAADRTVVRAAGGVGTALLAKLRRRALESMKQSRRGWLMRVDRLADTVALADWIRQASAAAGSDAYGPTRPVRAFVLDVDADASPAPAPQLPSSEGADLAAASRVVVVTGPEGGLTPTELERLRAVGANTVRLGDSVMRSATAAVAGAVTFSLAARRWQTDVL